MAYRIKGWKNFQHYKYRRPTWIKLYKTLLDDPEWHRLSGESAKTLIMVWLVASDHDGQIPSADTLSFRLRTSKEKAIAAISNLSHWVEHDASTPLDVGYQVAATEKSREEKSRVITVGDRATDLLFETFWKEYPRKVAKSKAREHWTKLRPNEELLRKMVDAIKAWRRSDQWTRDGGNFIPHPATWLNQRRWEDEIPKGGTSGKPKDEIDRLFERDEKRNREVRGDGAPNTLDEVSSLLRGVDKT